MRFTHLLQQPAQESRLILLAVALLVSLMSGLGPAPSAQIATGPDPGFLPLDQQTFGAPDIWIDTEVNGFGTYYGGVNADNVPVGSGDPLWVNEPNRVYARVHNFGAVVANNLTIKFYVRQPAVIGDPDQWQQIGIVQRFGPVRPRSFRDAVIEWTPQTDIPASIKVVIDSISNDANPANNSVIENSSFMDIDFSAGETTFDFVVHNSSSQGDTFTFTATVEPDSSGGQPPEPNAKVEQLSGWSVQLTPQTKFLQPGEAVTVNARVAIEPCNSQTPARAALRFLAQSESGFLPGKVHYIIPPSIDLFLGAAYQTILTMDCSAGDEFVFSGQLSFAPEEFILCRQPPPRLLAHQFISVTWFRPDGRYNDYRGAVTRSDGRWSATPPAEIDLPGTWTVRAYYGGVKPQDIYEIGFVPYIAAAGPVSCTFQVGGCTPPTITCPASVSVTSNTPTIVAYPPPTVTNDCPATTTCTPPSGSTFPVGTTTINCTTTDSAGDTAACSFTVTVSAQPCTISCPADVTASTDPDQCGATVNYPAPTTTGNCGAVTCTPASGSFFPAGATDVTCTTADGQNCSFTVTVNDTTPPVIDCPDDVTLPPGDGCLANVEQLATATDNCDPDVAITSDPPLPVALPLGQYQVTFMATDASGNTATCMVTVTVVNTGPTANAGGGQTVCPGATVTLDGSGSSDPDAGQTLTYQWTQTGGPAAALSGADTAMPTFFVNPNNPDYLCGVTFTFQLTVTDTCGATAMATVVITIGGPCCA